MLGGAIGVSSKLRQGSTFAFFVKSQRVAEPQKTTVTDTQVPPAVKASLDSLASDTGADILREESRLQSAKAKMLPHASPANSRVINVLIVEDNLINQKVVRTQLRRHGYTVEVANHGVEALEWLKKTMNAGGGDQNFDVVLMDLEMPIMGGLECVQNIRKLEQDGSLAGHVPVIAVTANARRQYTEAAMEAGMDAVTTKPYQMKDLVEQIERVRRM
jgi:CheY-like chemotaxis protein